jgi:hypothetical protein
VPVFENTPHSRAKAVPGELTRPLNQRQI